jgi:site-specific recombinase XerD
MLTETNHSLSIVEKAVVKERLLEYKEIFEKLPFNTQKSYNADMKHFLGWCIKNNMDSFKPELAHNKLLLKAYFASMIDGKLSRATIIRRKAPLSKFLQILEWPNPFNQVIFNEWLSSSLKQIPAFQKQATALTHDLLDDINSKLDEKCSFQLRDKVLLNIMFDGLLRASELCSLKCNNINFKNKTLFLASSKTDQEARGAYRALSDTSLKLINLWKTQYNVVDGYLLRSLTPSKCVTNRGLQYSSVYEAFKRFSKLTNIEEEVFSTHSARVGGAVTLAEHDCSILDIQHAGGWKTPAMPVRYTEQTNIHKSGMGSIIKKLGR